MSNMEYLQHLQYQSVRHFHRGDFVLVLHNMYEQWHASSISYLRCSNKFGENVSLGEQISGMTFQELKTSINRKHAGLTVTDPVCARFLKSIHAICKSLGHTSEAAKGARMRILGDMVHFGASAIFLMVTPDDSNCL